MMRAVWIVVLVVAATLHARAQSNAAAEPVELDSARDVKLLTPRVAIHADDEPEPAGLTPIQKAMRTGDRVFGGMVSVAVDVVVNENGRVESAHAVSGPERFHEQAEAIVMQRAYEPVRVNGTIVRARFQDWVTVYPKEIWADTATPFPADETIHHFAISLERTGCLGSCPSYKVTIDSDGEVAFEAPPTYNYVAVPGKHKARVSRDVAWQLLDSFRAARFLSALKSYACNWTDLPSQTLTLEMDGMTKEVSDYGGGTVGLPDAVESLEARVDEAAGTARWVRGNEETLPALKAEGWNFASASAENLNLYDTVLRQNLKSVVGAFLAAKAPIVSTDAKVLSPVCVASGAGDRAAVQEMLNQHGSRRKLPAAVLSECVDMSAQAGNAGLIQLWLDHGASVLTAPVAKDEDTDVYHATPLLSTIRSGNLDAVALVLSRHPGVTPAANNGRAVTTFALGPGRYGKADGDKLRMLEMLIQAGASVNDETDDDRHAIFEVDDAPEALPLLIAAGANVNDRAEDGRTPLMMNVYDAAAVKALLDAGADPALKAKDGKTALDAAKSSSCKECVALIEKAIQARAASPAP